ncbi:MAG: hypothetical protein F6K65_32550 [Moorea sp. SIO3C2]|nr:hypothetical protein [Moorena sp. SIO3C2]
MSKSPRIGGFRGRCVRLILWWAVLKTSLPKQINLTAALPTLLSAPDFPTPCSLLPAPFLKVFA